MKNIGTMAILLLISGTLAGTEGYGQVSSGYGQLSPGAKPSVIEPHLLPITCAKTTTLVFPSAVQSVDRGSRDVLAQKAKGAQQNVLWVKAARDGMPQTNLTVITADGKLYSYLVDYSLNPSVLTLCYPDAEPSTAVVSFPKAFPNEAELKAVARKIAGMKASIRGKKDRNAGMSLRLTGIYIHGDVLYCRLRLRNKTHLSYPVDQLKFTIRDQTQPKRTASQERELRPLFVQGDTAMVGGGSERTMVFALPLFTIPDRKHLWVEVMEQNGGRHLRLQIRNKTILRARHVSL